ncbi:hypothetical protein NPIL_54891 [Nephila pilipes]|uniref:Uncharacterized protein n=1 Tax=Nephila pilipes TaxID=299642 RepID=A0A8X6QDM5_NEPPI|nr:hypothetical protein NPIL_54891 [Nephila pilipes]
MDFLRSCLISSSSIWQYLVVQDHSSIQFFIHIGPAHHLVFTKMGCFTAPTWQVSRILFSTNIFSKERETMLSNYRNACNLSCGREGIPPLSKFGTFFFAIKAFSLRDSEIEPLTWPGCVRIGSVSEADGAIGGGIPARFVASAVGWIHRGPWAPFTVL